MRLTNDDVLDMDISTDETPNLIVRGHSGDITIRSTQRSSIHVHVEDFEPDHGHLGEEPLATSQVGNRVTLDTHRNPGMLHADLQIEVPAGTALTVNTIDGDLVIDDTQGPVDLTTVGGDIHLNRTRGTAQITTVDGDVVAEYLDGTLTLQTTNGDVNVRRSTLRRFNVHSMNGDFLIETPLAAGEHYFAKTTNGDIQLAIPRETGATVQMRSTNGDFHSDLRTEVINPSRRHWQGRINGGGANVELETVNGDVHLTEAHGLGTFEAGSGFDASDLPDEPVDAEAPAFDAGTETESARFDPADTDRAPSQPDYSGPESIEVLARLERGEITVEDAMEQLDRLR